MDEKGVCTPRVEISAHLEMGYPYGSESCGVARFHVIPRQAMRQAGYRGFETKKKKRPPRRTAKIYNNVEKQRAGTEAEDVGASPVLLFKGILTSPYRE